MSNLGKWDSWYAHLGDAPSAFKYGDTASYACGAEYLKDCLLVEDWGVGAGGFKRFRPDAVGLDGSHTPFADKIVDLAEYTSAVDGIFMRHVLEHNHEWQKVLTNALLSARKVSLVLFIPFSEVTTEVAHNKGAGVDVPDLSLGSAEFFTVLEEAGAYVEKMTKLDTCTGYGGELVLYIRTRS